MARFGLKRSGGEAGTSIHGGEAHVSRGMSEFRRPLAALAVAAWIGTPANASDTLEEAGDILQFAIPLFAFGTTYVKDDLEGRRQLGRSALTTGLTVQGLKYAVDKWRPNFSDTKSFPSGHTAAAFVGASFLQTRYGARYGIPAYIAAAFVGYSRIQAEKHYADDVLAGASIALLSNWYFAEPIDQSVTLTPTLLEDGYGVNVTFALGQPNAARAPVKPLSPRARFAFSFGAMNIDDNEARAPRSGTPIDLERFDTFSSPTTTSKVDAEFFLSDRHEIAFVLDPLDVRDETTLNAPVSFASTVYPSGVLTQLEFALSEIRGVYRYKLVDEDRFELKIGAGLAWQYTWVRLVSGTLDNAVDNHTLLPYLSAQASVELWPDVTAQLQIEGTEFDSNSIFDAQVSLRYQLTPHWDIGFGLRRYHREMSATELVNEFEGSSYFLTIGRSF